MYKRKGIEMQNRIQRILNSLMFVFHTLTYPNPKKKEESKILL